MRSPAPRLRLDSLEDRVVPAAFTRVFSYDVGGETAAEISAYDPAAKRLFVLNGELDKVEVLNLTNPAAPADVGDLTLPAVGGFTQGEPNSVAAKNGLVAVAYQAAVKTDPGRVAFFSAATGAFLGSFPTGAQPDMVAFTPDGLRVTTADEGEANSYGQPGSVNPEGSVTIVTLTAPGSLAGATAATATFTSFNGQEAALRARGIRIYGPGATAAQDLEPEYIAFSPDSATAYVTLQENNAVAVVNLATATVTEVRPLGLKDFGTNVATVRTYDFDPAALPTVGTTAPSGAFPQGQAIKLGGFSGLFFEGTDPATGNLRFITHTDRGPNGEPTDIIPGTPGAERPFVLPSFQPRLVRFQLNPTTGAITLTGQILLTKADGTPLTGLPNLQAGAQGSPYTDEVPVDLFGNVIPNDPVGADLEGIVVAPDGTFWMVDEYRPAVYHFDATGRLLERFVPQGTAAAAGAAPETFGTESLPAVLGQYRRANRGFEAVAFDPAVNKLYAFVQTTLDNPDTSTAGVRNNGNVRVVEFDVGTKQVTAEYVYVMRDTTAAGTAKTDKIGDAVALGGGKFLVAERDDRTGADSNKLIYEIDLAGATNVTGLPNPLTAPAAPAGQTIEQLNAAELAAAGIVPVKKTLRANAAAAGYTGVSKLEGLARVNATTFAVLNDNDFGVLAQAIAGDGTVPLNPNPEPIRLGLLSFAGSNGLDASDREVSSSAGRINIQQWPVFGMYQPDAIATYTVGGKTYYVTANEGDDRNDLLDPDETDRVGSAGYVLDPTVFPNAAVLKQNANLGRLTVSRATGDTDGDGDFDQIHMLGARSFSIWDAATGARVYDSGDALERLTALLVAARFNSDGTAASFDTRSDNKGPEPEAVAVGVIDGRTYAFVGMERTGGIAVFDVTDPLAPRFTDFLDTPGDVAPEGLIFIPAADSPTGRPAVVVSNEVSGTVTMYSVAAEPFVLQLLHASDLEPGIAAVQDAPRFAAVVDYLERDLFAAGDPRKQAFAGSVLLSSGDNLIAGPFYAAGGDPSLNGVLNSNPAGTNGDVASPGRAGIEIMNRIGFDASVLGNHEFDQGQRELRNVIQAQAGQANGTNAPAPARQYRGALFPYLSANLNFAGTDLSGSIAPAGVSTTGLAAGRIAPSAVIDADGDGPGQEFVGVIGITTPLLASISSPGNVGISPAGVTGALTPAQLQELAGIIQAQVTILQALGIDKIILLSHLQQFSEEQALAPLLSGVDVIIAGGSDTRLADSTDVLRPGDAAEGPYPVVAAGADGNPLLLVSTDGNFSYVGRLVLTFDANGVIQTNALNAAVNGAYAADQAGVERLYGAGAVAEAVSPKAAAVKLVTDAVGAVITQKDSALFGRSEVYLNGLRAEVRTEETNLGNLTADANLYAARQFDTGTQPTTVSIKNGGGIRDSIGTVGSTSGARGPTAANPAAGKVAGQVSDLDIENSLRFNNTLSVVTVTAAQVKILLEHAVAATAAGATPGQFAQIGGIRFSFDTAGTPLTATGNTTTGQATFAGGTRVRNAAIVDEAGNVIDVLVRDGQVVGDPARLVRVVTLSFLVDDADGNGLGGDNYPFATFRAQLGVGVFNRVDLAENGGPLGEQRALELYLQAEFPAGGPGYAQADTPVIRDNRIQNLQARAAAGAPDTVLAGLSVAPQSLVTPEDVATGPIVLTPTAESGTAVHSFVVTSVTGGTLTRPDGSVVFPTLLIGGLVSLADGAAGLRFVPAANFNGVAGFTVQAQAVAEQNGQFTSLVPVGGVQTVVVTVTPVNDPPTAGPAEAYTVMSGSRLTVGSPGLLANDTDPEGDPIAAELVSGPAAAQGTVSLSPNGSFVFTPAPGFTGRATFTYRVTAGATASGPITVTVTVTPPADPAPALIDPATGAPASAFDPFPGATSPANLAVGDVTGDGVADVVAGAGNGGPVVRVFDGKAPGGSTAFFAYDPSFRGGVDVAVGDLNGDGVDDIVTGPGAGGSPHVKVFDGKTGREVASFFAFDPSFRGGVNVAVADVNGDGVLDLVAGAGVGGSPHVKVFDGLSGAEVSSFFAFDPNFRGGVLVAAGDVDGDGAVEVVAVAGDAGAPHVRTFDVTGRGERSFFAFDPSVRVRLRVAAADVNGDGVADVVVGPEEGTSPAPRAFSGRTGDPLDGVLLAAIPVD